MSAHGPLAGVTAIEFAGLGPAPFTGMMLADQGARVIRIDRPTKKTTTSTQRDGDVLSRGRESIGLDLQRPEAVDVALRLIERADILSEGFRPDEMESLGLGPDICLKRRPSLVYGRVTGWGQTGPLANAAGHDINYIALTGALHAVGRPGEPPVPTAGMIGDFGGGGMLLAFGILCALHAAKSTGKGQVVDTSICDGSALLASLLYGWRGIGAWHAQAGTNTGDGGAPFFSAYECADGGYVSVGAIEPQFYAQLRKLCGLNDPDFEHQWDERRWPLLKRKLAEVFRTRTRAEWCALLEGTDACFAPVLGFEEAPTHPHNVARGTFARVNGVTQPAPAPKFGGTPAAPCKPVIAAGAHTCTILSDIGLGNNEISLLLKSGAAWSKTNAQQ